MPKEKELTVVCTKMEAKKHSIRFYASKDGESSKGKAANTPAFESIYVSRIAMLENGILSPKGLTVTLSFTE